MHESSCKKELFETICKNKVREILPTREQNSSGVLNIDRELIEGLLLAICNGSLFKTVTRTQASPTRRAKEDGAR